MIFNYLLLVNVIQSLFFLQVSCQDSLKIDTLPKCCDSFSSIIKKNSSLICQNSTSSRFVLNSTKVVDEINKTLCVDTFKSDLAIFELQNGDINALTRNISSELFHKCCPLGYRYDYHNKSCEKIDLPSCFQETFVSVGLPDCKIIRDYIYPTLELAKKRLDEDDLGHCLDQTISDEYVVRVCETINVCQSTRCLRKCCGDGKSFVNGSNCRDTFAKGFRLDQLSNHIENLNCKYITA